ncbi:predicted protein [Naegleria gruberi]|uniref:Predicted protein n=1 Tax=Naegleria gruberi TaxID=5762 RepID=D2V9I3_NAEGR|nr:uncharacterized protein NAEGRDRAFT_47703 [Naegleria gruberi]EFC46465.1 predicted protein [Naegleria gruberi]|eukprot:XP_002679209.1 predicted protein [Naegleria gruberi strain NEG-M]
MASEHYSNGSNSSSSPRSNEEFRLVSPTDSSSAWTIEGRNEQVSPNLVGNKIKKPRRLRKQINNDHFKQFYFELKVNESNRKKEGNCQGMNSQHVDSTAASDKSGSSSSVSSGKLKRKESYEILQFETAQEKDEETLYQERIKNEIKANSHHFCLPSNKKKKTNAKHQQDINQSVNNQEEEILQPCNNIPVIYQPPINPIVFNEPNVNPVQFTEPVTNQISIDNAELLSLILQLLTNNNNK